MIEGLIAALANIFLQPTRFFALVMGAVLGFLGGATPGISGTMMVVVFLPITFGMEPGTAFLLLTSIYAAAVFSGAISAILFRTPGAPEAVATVLDGYPMAQKGKAGEALGLAVWSSAAGGTIGAIILMLSAPMLARVALRFSSPEYFALAILGITVVTSLGGEDVLKGVMGALFGLFLATVGLDSVTGVERFTFGSPHLMSGIDFITVLIGMFAIAEVLRKFQEKNVGQNLKTKVVTKLPDLSLMKRLSGLIARSSLLGTFIGVLPGIGATTAAMMGYSEAVRWSKHPEKFGTGIPEGIAAPESANNAAAAGAMVPLMALGIPGSATTAVILGAFILHGIQPGPLMFQYQKDLVYTIFLGLILVNLLIILLSKPFITIFAQVMRVPYSIMGTMIVVFCIIGTFAVRNSIVDVWMMLAFGVIGYLFDKAKIPIAPIILGLVLGPLAEEEFRRSLILSGGDYMIFFNRPISAVLLILAVLSCFMPLFSTLWNRYKKKEAHGTISS